jgi:HlyD family secretion protein
VKVAITRSPVILRMGMTSNVDITTGTKDKIIKVPAIAIIEKDGKKFVYVIEGNKAKVSEIRTGLESDEESEITDGLREGEQIIITNFDKLSNGKQVKVTQGGAQK